MRVKLYTPYLIANCVHRSKTSFPNNRKKLRNEKVEKNKNWEAKPQKKRVPILYFCQLRVWFRVIFLQLLKKSWEKAKKLRKWKSWKWKVKGPFYAFNSDLHPAFKVKLPQHSKKVEKNEKVGTKWKYWEKGKRVSYYIFASFVHGSK